MDLVNDRNSLSRTLGFLFKASCCHARKLLGVVSSYPGLKISPDRPALHSQRALIRPHDLWGAVRSNCSVRKISLFSKLNISKRLRSGTHKF